jgi:glycosyltransferase involved in cell wall biosynthesis
LSEEKITIITLGDHPLSPSGVGTQTKYMIEALLKTGKYKFISFGGAIKHENYEPVKTNEFGDDWIIHPIDGYGNQDLIRSVIRNEKPNILWLMTDPRFWGWLWHIEHEIRSVVPMVYYHVWDNKPYPTFNNKFYESNDVIACISKVTHDIVKNVAPETKSVYLPHTVDPEIFKKYPTDEIEALRKESFGDELDGKFVVFWNSRNARRKQSGSLIFWFKAFLDKVGHDKATLLMHTDVKDPHGQDLEAIIHHLGLINGEVSFSTNKYPPETLAKIYNMADCTVGISDAEGFGLSTFESLTCETPIIVTMTGGLQEQVTDGKEWFGIGLEPTSKAIIGSQDIPWIYEDRLSERIVVDALLKMYNMTKEERAELGRKGREHVTTNYNFEEFGKKWDELFTYVHNELGSWDTRKGYQSWELKEIV